MAGSHTMVLLRDSTGKLPFALKVTSVREAYAYRHRKVLGLDEVLPFGVPLTKQQCDSIFHGKKIGLGDTIKRVLQVQLDTMWANRVNKSIDIDAVTRNDDFTLVRKDDPQKTVPYTKIEEELRKEGTTALLMENVFYGLKNNKSIDVKIGQFTKSEIQYEYEYYGGFRVPTFLKIMEHWGKDKNNHSRKFGVDLTLMSLFSFIAEITVNAQKPSPEGKETLISLCGKLDKIGRAFERAPCTLVGSSIILSHWIPEDKPESALMSPPLVCLIDPDHPIIKFETVAPEQSRQEWAEEAARCRIVSDLGWEFDPQLAALRGSRSFASYYDQKRASFLTGLTTLRALFKQGTERFYPGAIVPDDHQAAALLNKMLADQANEAGAAGSQHVLPLKDFRESQANFADGRNSQDLPDDPPRQVPEGVLPFK